MPLIAPKSQRVLPPEGTHPARLVRIIHIGSIVEKNFHGEDALQNKINLMFELSEKLHIFREGEDAKPFVISNDYTLSMGEKANLRKLVEGILGKALTPEEALVFDIEELLGNACLLTIKYKTSTRTGNTRAEIAHASPLIEGMVAKEAFNQPKLLTYQNFDEAYFATLPEFLREKMVTSIEYKQMTDPTRGAYPKDQINLDDIPF